MVICCRYYCVLLVVRVVKSSMVLRVCKPGRGLITSSTHPWFLFAFSRCNLPPLCVLCAQNSAEGKTEPDLREDFDEDNRDAVLKLHLATSQSCIQKCVRGVCTSRALHCMCVC